MKKRGQVGMEFLFVAAIAFTIVAGILIYSMRQSSSNININEGADAVKSLVAAADTVYALGPGSERYVTVTFPGGTQNTTITTRSVILYSSLFGGTTDFHARSNANLTGSLPDSRGTYRIQVKMLESGVVQFNNTG